MANARQMAADRERMVGAEGAQPVAVRLASFSYVQDVTMFILVTRNHQSTRV